MGEGRHYISLSDYMKQFGDRLGYEPFPDTLNVHLDDDAVHARAGMAALDTVPVNDWEDDERTFGSTTRYAASVTIGGDSYESAHIIAPERIHHDESQPEIVASDRLRDELDLNDGDTVTVRVGKAEYE